MTNFKALTNLNICFLSSKKKSYFYCWGPERPLAVPFPMTPCDLSVFLHSFLIFYNCSRYTTNYYSLNMSKKHQKYRRYLLTLICQNLKNNRKHRLSITHKLNVIEYVLRNGISWISLNKSSFTKGEESSYRKFFYKLCKTNIFSKALNNFIITIPKQVYTDTTTILNKLGRLSDVAYCSKDKKHKGVKISTYCDDNRFVYPPIISKANVHDIKLLEPTLDINLKPKCIVGDLNGL